MKTIQSPILHTYPCNLPRFQAMCQPEGTSSVPSWPVCVCVCDRNTVKVEDGCLLLLTGWWIATGLGECLVHRMSGVRKAVSSFTVTQSKHRCKHISIQMHHCQCSLSQYVIIILFNFQLRNLENYDTSKNTPAQCSFSSSAGCWHFSSQEIHEMHFESSVLGENHCNSVITSSNKAKGHISYVWTPQPTWDIFGSVPFPWSLL